MAPVMNQHPVSPQESLQFPLLLRLSGILLLSFFLIRLAEVWRLGTLADVLWMCNIANLGLALGLFAGQPVMIRPAVLWLGLGFPQWVWFMTQAGNYAFSSWLTHIGALAVGIVAIARVRAERRAWIYAFIWFLVIQQFCRLFTPPALNVNMAHGMQIADIHTVWQKIFTAYWQFRVTTTLLTALCLWVAGVILRRLFPPRALRAHELSVEATTG
jgi:hypothetical protein